MRRVLIRGARQLLTLRGPRGARRGAQLGELSIIQDGAVLIEDGRIRDVGPTRRVENLAAASSAHCISAEGRVVMPGFVDCHTHLVGGQQRSMAADESTTGGNDHGRDGSNGVKAVRAVSSRKLEAEARQILRGCLNYGTTSVEGKSALGLDETTEWRSLKVLGALLNEPIDVIPTFHCAQAVPAEFEGHVAPYVAALCKTLLPQLKEKRLATFVDVFCDASLFNEAQLRSVLSTARALDLPVKINSGPFEPHRSVALALEHGAVSIDHPDYLDEEDIRALGRSHTIATLLPACAFLADGQRAPARALVEAGAAIALGTNYSYRDTPGYSMQMTVALARQQLHLQPAEAIMAATLNAACALQMGRHVGTIEPGKYANLLVLKTPDYRDIAYSPGMNLVEKTFWHGQIVHG